MNKEHNIFCRRSANVQLSSKNPRLMGNKQYLDLCYEFWNMSKKSLRNVVVVSVEEQQIATKNKASMVNFKVFT